MPGCLSTFHLTRSSRSGFSSWSRASRSERCSWIAPISRAEWESVPGALGILTAYQQSSLPPEAPHLLAALHHAGGIVHQL
jgi:hypothetical protein